jgi:hypothetical protein
VADTRRRRDPVNPELARTVTHRWKREDCGGLLQTSGSPSMQLQWHDRLLLPPVDTSAFPPTLGITRPCGLMHEER